MVNYELNQLLQAGTTTSDDVLKQQVIKEVIYKQSNLLTVGQKVLPARNLDVLDVNFSYPSEMEGAYPVPEGKRGDFEKLTWADFGFSMQKGQVTFKVTDESVIRSIQAVQNRMNITQAAAAMAKKEDAEIMAAIIAGAGQTVNITTPWDNAAGDPEADIVAARQKIMHNSNVTSAEIRNLALIVGTNVSSELLKLQLIGNVQQKLSDYLQSAFGITMYETRDTGFADLAVLMVTGEQTGIHGIYTGGAVPLVEQWRDPGVGDAYLVTKYFKTKIVPESTTQATTNRIVKLSNTAT